MNVVNRPLRALILVATTWAVASCQTPLQPHGPVPPALQGRVQWTLPRMAIAASVSDIQANGTVSLVDPLTSETLASTQASGPAGEFSFAFGSSGQLLRPGFYWLEAARFMGGSSNAGITLRTILHLGDSGWDSVSGSDVQVTPLTTAVARISTLDPAVTDQETLGFVIPPHQPKGALGLYDAATLTALAGEVAVAVAADGDAGGDLPLPATVTPTSGTPGITQLQWRGPISPGFDFVRQHAVGTDRWGQAVEQTSTAGFLDPGWASIAPEGVVGTTTLRLLVGTARSLGVPWTAIEATALRPATPDAVTSGSGPAGPQAAWILAGGGEVHVAPLTETGLGTPAVLATSGATGVAVASSSVGHRHVLTAENGQIKLRSAVGGAWSPPTVVSVATGTCRQPQLAYDGQSGLWGAWLSETGGKTTLQLSRYSNGKWSAIEDPFENVADFALAGGLDPHLAWTDKPAGDIGLVFYSRRIAGNWAQPSFMSTSGVDCSQVSIAVNAQGEPQLLWIAAKPVGVGRATTSVVFRGSGGGAWHAEETLPSSVIAAAGSPRLALDPNGMPVAIWVSGNQQPLVTLSRRNAPLWNWTDNVFQPGDWSVPQTMDDQAAAGLTAVAAGNRHWLLWRRTGGGSGLIGLPVVW